MKTALLALWVAGALAAQTADDLLSQMMTWQADTNRQPLFALSQMVQKASPQQKREIEQKFLAFLKSGATPAAKDFVCKQLSVAGSEASVPVLTAFLADPKTADMGRYALERIPGPAVDRALRESLTKTSGTTRIGIANTLGARRDAGSVAALRTLALGTQQNEATAAVYALGQIANAAAVEAISEAQTKTTGRVHDLASEALLQSANHMVERDRAGALAIYRTLYGGNVPGTVRAAALRGLAITGGAESRPVLMNALRGSDLRLQAIAVHGLMPNSSAQLIEEMPKLSEAAQVRILGLLSERGDRTGLPAFTSSIKSGGRPVRLAALQGVGTVGDSSIVATLAAIAAGDDPAEQVAARAALARLRPDSDIGIRDAIPTAAPKVKRELIRAAGERGANSTAQLLVTAARDTDNDVRRESLKALGSVAGEGDIPGLVALIVNPVQPDDRTDAARSLGLTLRRSDASQISKVLSAYQAASDLEVRSALLRVMGQSGNTQAFAVLGSALRDTDAGVKRAAIVSFAEWPDARPVGDLLEAARTASDQAHQILAVRSAIQLIGLPAPERPHNESARLAAAAMALARQPAEKRALLALLPRYPVKETLDLATSLANDPEVGGEAKTAAARLERTVRR